MPFSYRKSCKRYDVEGEAHCLTFSCFRRLPLFSRERSCLWMCESLRKGQECALYDLWAYVIMPEHVHVVLLPRPAVTISRILTALKQPVAKHALVWLEKYAAAFLSQLTDMQPNGKATHRFWQRGGGYDRNLRTLPDIYEKIEYVHNNPVRRGLVSQPQACQWSSSLAWETGVDLPVPINRDTLPPITEIVV